MAYFSDVTRVNRHKANRAVDKYASMCCRLKYGFVSRMPVKGRSKACNWRQTKRLCVVGGKSDGVLACLERGRSEAYHWRQLRLIVAWELKNVGFLGCHESEPS